ncbi:MAG TPA: hypothetical protein VNO31_24475 [Umezawaea sp.]|nr:hypothetical protein [Umezawaea sp.]
MRDQRREFVRLCRCVVTGPRWQVVVAVVVSAWTFAWILGQVGGAPSPLGVLRAPVDWAGIPSGWLDAAGEWVRARQGVLAGLAVVAGVLWAVTTERGRLAAPGGWLAVLVAAEAIGYAAAVHRALVTLAVVIGGFALLSLLGRRAFVVDRIALLPRGVLHAGATAVTLSAVVPLLAPGLLVAGLVRPYVTRPPRPDPTRARVPRQRIDSGRRAEADSTP